MRNKIENVLAIIGILVFVWFFVSFFDVVLNNLDGCQYHAWNFFTLFLRTFN